MTDKEKPIEEMTQEEVRATGRYSTCATPSAADTGEDHAEAIDHELNELHELNKGTMTREEYQRCCESPAYFFNNYVLIKDAMGNFVKPEPVTDEQLNEAAEKAQKESQKQLDYQKWRRLYAAINLFPDIFRGQKNPLTSVKQNG